MTFNTHKIPKEIKIGYQRGLGTTRTNLHDRQGNHGTGSRDCEVWKKGKEITKLKHTQNITYPEARRIIETTKYAEGTKKNIPTYQKTKLLYV